MGHAIMLFMKFLLAVAAFGLFLIAVSAVITAIGDEVGQVYRDIRDLIRRKRYTK